MKKKSTSYSLILHLVGLLLGFSSCSSVQANNFWDAINGLDPEDISQAAIDFVNLSVSPGISSAIFKVDQENRDVDLLRSNLGFAAEFSINESIFNGFWGLSLVQGKLEDELVFENLLERPVTINVDREIVSLQGSFGLSFPINKNLKYRPYLSLSAAKFDSHSSIIGNIAVDQLNSIFFTKSETESFTTSAVQEVLYDRWLNNSLLEVNGTYILAYTDTFDSSNDILDTFGWSQTGIIRARWSAPTKITFRGRPWWWNTYYSHVNFIGQKKLSLGFKYYNELGLGLDYEINIKPLNWFGLRYVGIKIGGIFGDNLTGGSAGLTFR